jgi:cytochrome c-type biogenesis protein CcmH/NrfF
MPDGDRDPDHRRRCIGRRRAAGDVSGARSAAQEARNRASLPGVPESNACRFNADLASDLRREVREQALAGKNDSEIRDYLVARYGDFVLYDPPLKRTTWLLWFGPFTLLAGGGVVWWQVLRRRQRASASAPTRDPAVEARARALLDDEPPA